MTKAPESSSLAQTVSVRGAWQAVMSLIPTDPELAEETLGRLAALFRYALEASTRLVVPLGDELACARDYLGIEALRFRERPRCSVSVDRRVANIE